MGPLGAHGGPQGAQKWNFFKIFFDPDFFLLIPGAPGARPILLDRREPGLHLLMACRHIYLNICVVLPVARFGSASSPALYSRGGHHENILHGTLKARNRY